jgi:hypothetical protein
MAKKSTLDQIERMRAASSVKAPKDFAKIRDKFSHKPVETLSKVIPEIKAHNKVVPLLKEADKAIALNKVGTITKEADDAYKAAKALGGPKKLFAKGSGKFGVLAALLGAGTTLLAPNSAAAKVIDRIGEAAGEIDPGTYLQKAMNDPTTSPEALRELALKAKNKNKIPAPELSEESISNVKGLLRGDEDTSSLLGERDIPDMEDGERLYRYNKDDELRKKLGYK